MSPVYFIQAGADGPVKVGHSADPVARLASLQTGHYLPLTLLGLAFDRSESELHERFQHHSLNGEWFEPHSDVLAAVEIPMAAYLEAIGHMEELATMVVRTTAKLRVGDREQSVCGVLTLATILRNAVNALGVDEADMDSTVALLVDRLISRSTDAGVGA